MSSAAPVAVGPRHASGRRPPRTAPGVVRRVLRRLAGAVASLLLVVAALAFLALGVGPHVFGYRTATMLTGSMEPGIMPGDVVVTVPRPASEVHVGEVVSYHIPVEDHRVETHRIVQVIHHRDGTIAIRTKGDANQDPDPWTATLQGDTVWEMKAVVPKLGSAIRTLRSPAVEHGVFWIAIGGLLLVGLSTIWGGSEGETESEDAP